MKKKHFHSRTPVSHEQTNKIVLMALLSVLMTGCASHVKSWEKGILAESHMQLGGGDSQVSKVNEHVFTSKEGSFGGGGIGGGGCGCN